MDWQGVGSVHALVVSARGFLEKGAGLTIRLVWPPSSWVSFILQEDLCSHKRLCMKTGKAF